MAKKRKWAEKYVRSQLRTIFGSAKKGVERIGTAKFDELVRKVERAIR